MSNKLKRYIKEFKLKIVELYKNGKPTMKLAKEHGIARSTVNKLISHYTKTKSF